MCIFLSDFDIDLVQSSTRNMFQCNAWSNTFPPASTLRTISRLDRERENERGKGRAFFPPLPAGEIPRRREGGRSHQNFLISGFSPFCPPKRHRRVGILISLRRSPTSHPRRRPDGTAEAAAIPSGPARYRDREVGRTCRRKGERGRRKEKDGLF